MPYFSAVGTIVVNNVIAKVVEEDILLKNGVLHIVDSVLGVPTRSAWDFIQSQEALRLVNQTISANSNLFNVACAVRHKVISY